MNTAIPLSQESLTTHCEGCSFQYKHNYSNDTQAGCLIQSLQGEAYDVINGSFKFKTKICQYKRGLDWCPELRFTDDRWRKVRDEVSINYGVVINSDNLENIQKICNTAISGIVKPSRFFIFSNLGVELDQYLMTTNVKWTVCNYMDTTDFRAHLLNTDKKCHFYAFVDENTELSPWLFDFIDYAINNLGVRFKCIGGSVLIIPRVVYQFNQGSLSALLEYLKTKPGYIDYEDFTRQAIKEYSGIIESLAEARYANRTLDATYSASTT